MSDRCRRHTGRPGWPGRHSGSLPARPYTGGAGRRRVLQLLLPAALFLWACNVSADHEESVVRKVYDGDTVLVSASSGSRMVRLVGIDAPERAKSAGEPAQPFSRKSRDYLSQRIKGKKVMIRDWGSDRYGRLLGEVILEGENINLEMIRLGLAEVYRGRPPERFDISAYRSAETKARATGRGIWSLGSRYRSPVDWKHGRK